MSTNIVESICYTVERIHSGLLAHLFIKGRDTPHGDAGKRFLDALGVGERYAKIGNAVPEWKNIDLVLTSADKKTPIVAFEFKVDSREGRRKGKWQMQRYRDRLESKWSKVPLFYVTLGLSGVYEKSNMKHYRWIDLNEFVEAVKPTESLERFYEDWIGALRTELHLRKAAKNGQPDSTELDSRPGAWNIYLMASLREELIHKEEVRVWNTSSLYTYGQKPDTIWNLGRLPEQEQHLYAEVNSNGKLNLKIRFGEGAMARREPIFREERASFEERLQGFDPKPNEVGGFSKKTKTLLSVDVGLSVEKKTGRFAFAESREHVLDRLRRVAADLSLRG